MRAKSLWLLALGLLARRSVLAKACWLLAFEAAAQEVFVPLHEGWSFQQVGKEQWHPAQVPGTVHDDLLRNRLIPDPMRNANIDSVQWVENEDWIYQCTFTVNDPLARKQHIDLVFKGLDTFAEVYLNDSLLGKADNMFRQWEWPVKDLLKSGENELKVIFHSTIKEGARLRDAYGIQLPHDNDPSGVSPYVRKAAYQFGWDFAPRLVGCGIWREVGLRGWDEAYLTGFKLHCERGYTALRVNYFFSEDLNEDAFRFSVYLDGRLIGRKKSQSGLDRTLHRQRRKRSVNPMEISQLDLVMSKGSKVVSKKQGLVRWSRVEIGAPADTASFGIMVADVPHFAKGCNLIPPGTLLTQRNDHLWLDLVKGLKDAGMDFVRVWAGGVYPPDCFFDACAREGILVWQDFMVANLLPSEGDFRYALYEEAYEEAYRLFEHPSVALMCGNNELDVAWSNWGWQDRYALHLGDSVRVIDSNHRLWREDLLRACMASGSVSYTPTSPLSNWGSAEGLKSGDLHYWGVWHGDSAFSSFRNNVGRFVSEYGFQSYPDSVTLAHYIDPEHLYLGSPMLAKRQKSYKTDKPIWTAIEREMGEKPTTLGRFIDCSQVMQAEAYRIAIWAHRTNQPHCMGTLYWQLNDVWAAPTWSTIDVDGRWKAAHYEVKRSYADRVLAFEPTATGGTALELWSDSELNGDSVILELWSDDGQLFDRQVHWVQGSGKRRLVEWPKDGFPKGVEAFAFGCGADARCHRVEVLKGASIPQVPLKLVPVAGSPGEWEASCPVPVRMVEVVTGQGEHPSDNWFPLVPGHPKRFTMKPLNAVPQLSTFLR